MSDLHLLLIVSIVLVALAHFEMMAFIRKLYVLNRHTLGLEVAQPSQAPGSSALNLLGLMTKYTLLTAISIAIITLNVVAVLCAALLSGYSSDESFVLTTSVTTANVLIDVVCLALSFKFHQKHYV